MGSPFPGMDPYLEGDMWQEIHERLANQISIELMPKLAPKYVALLAKRYVLERTGLSVFDVPVSRVFYPDVHVVRTNQEANLSSGSTLVATPPTVQAINIAPQPQLSIEVRDVAQRRLVTVIEILSPANKLGDGAREYNDRRDDLLNAKAHLLEIDLLRIGNRIPFSTLLPPAPYYAFLRRSEERFSTLVWAIQINQRLPVLPVPLLAPDPDVLLDLQAALNACFALVGYERLLDYSVPPPPPDLIPDELAWIDSTLRTTGYRSSSDT